MNFNGPFCPSQNVSLASAIIEIEVGKAKVIFLLMKIKMIYQGLKEEKSDLR